MQMVFPNLVAQVLLYENFTLQSTSRDYINVLLVLILYYVFEITTYTFNFAFFCLTPFISDGFLIFFCLNEFLVVAAYATTMNSCVRVPVSHVCTAGLRSKIFRCTYGNSFR